MSLQLGTYTFVYLFEAGDHITHHHAISSHQKYIKTPILYQLLSDVYYNDLNAIVHAYSNGTDAVRRPSSLRVPLGLGTNR